MGRGKTLIQKGAVQRVTRGILAAAAAAGVTGDIEVNLVTGVIKFHIGGDLGLTVPAATVETSEDLRKIL